MTRQVSTLLKNIVTTSPHAIRIICPMNLPVFEPEKNAGRLSFIPLQDKKVLYHPAIRWSVKIQ